MHEITPATEKLLATVSSWKGRVSFQVNFTGRNLKPSPLFGHRKNVRTRGNCCLPGNCLLNTSVEVHRLIYSACDSMDQGCASLRETKSQIEENSYA